MKPKMQTSKFDIKVLGDSLGCEFDIRFVGIVFYKKYPPDPIAVYSDWDYQGYLEFEDWKFTYILVSSNGVDNYYLEESEVPKNYYEKFSEILNIRMGF